MLVLKNKNKIITIREFVKPWYLKYPSKEQAHFLSVHMRMNSGWNLKYMSIRWGSIPAGDTSALSETLQSISSIHSSKPPQCSNGVWRMPVSASSNCARTSSVMFSDWSAFHQTSETLWGVYFVWIFHRSNQRNILMHLDGVHTENLL